MTLLVTGALASLEGGARGCFGALFALLRFEQGSLGDLLACNDLVQLGWVWPLRLLRQKLSSLAQVSEFRSVSFRLLVCLPRALPGFGHPLPCPLGRPLGLRLFAYQSSPDFGHFRVLHRDFGKPVIGVQAQAKQEIANAVLAATGQRCV